MPIDAIRQADESDLDELVRVLRAAFASQAEELGLTAETAPWHVAFREAAVTEREMGYLTFFLLIADGRTAGCVAIQNDVEDVYGGDGYIGRVAVHPDYRRRGYAHLLLRFAETALRDRGARSVRLVVLSALSDLVTFYAAQGYETVGHREFRGFDLTDMDRTLVV
ncbi:MAG: GNAT family N-acetyltransferase [Armatimonadota bacterium]|jgi:ribosomal protein S18 acetylase RimI-like enzyme